VLVLGQDGGVGAPVMPGFAPSGLARTFVYGITMRGSTWVGNGYLRLGGTGDAVAESEMPYPLPPEAFSLGLNPISWLKTG